MKMYVVTYLTDIEVVFSEERSEWIQDYVCELVSGEKLANLYGFSDCSGDNNFKAWEITANGNLLPVVLHTPTVAPYNRLLIEDVYGQIDIYEWDEH